MGSIKTLIHLHTDYSLDSNLSLEALAWSVANERIGCVAVTDHDTIDGALRFQSMTDAIVIVGEEITTRDGHLIGLFLHERIPPGMSARDTAAAIRAQGGLVFVPHPFVRFYGCGLRHRLDDVTDLIDAVEINNAQNILKRPDRQAERFAEQVGLLRYVGADTHRAGTIAPCYQYMRPFQGPDDFLKALAAARLVPGYHAPRYLATMAYTAVRAIAGLGMPSDCGAHARVRPAVDAYPPATDLAGPGLEPSWIAAASRPHYDPARARS